MPLRCYSLHRCHTAVTQVSLRCHSNVTRYTAVTQLSLRCHSNATRYKGVTQLSLRCHSCATQMPLVKQVSHSCHSSVTHVPRRLPQPGHFFRTFSLWTMPTNVPWKSPLHFPRTIRHENFRARKIPPDIPPWKFPHPDFPAGQLSYTAQWPLKRSWTICSWKWVYPIIGHMNLSSGIC